jgi:hypothetical protein
MDKARKDALIKRLKTISVGDTVVIAHIKGGSRREQVTKIEPGCRGLSIIITAGKGRPDRSRFEFGHNGSWECITAVESTKTSAVSADVPPGKGISAFKPRPIPTIKPSKILTNVADQILNGVDAEMTRNQEAGTYHSVEAAVAGAR